jgi:hypothetical protein
MEFNILREAKTLFPNQELMMPNNMQARCRAEALFKPRKVQLSEATQAWEEYEAQRRAIAEKTKRLRELRLAKEAAQTKAC